MKAFQVNGVVLVSLLLTLTHFTLCSSVSNVNFKQVNADWENSGYSVLTKLNLYKTSILKIFLFEISNEMDVSSFPRLSREKVDQ